MKGKSGARDGYAVKEIFLSLQGEGFHSGRKAAFVRLAGCDVNCPWCDTDYAGGTRMTAEAIAARCVELWGPAAARRWCVLTGGEPTLQADAELISALKRSGFGVAIETAGHRPLPPGLDWITVSPKAGFPLLVTAGDEIKVVWPQPEIDPEALEALPFAHHFVQPLDGPDPGAAAACLELVMARPRWRLSLQLHKILGVR